MDESFCREPEVRATMGMTSVRATWDLVAEGLLPPAVRIGVRAVGWPRSEIRKVVAARISGMGNDELREFVRAMVQQRAHALALLEN